MIKNLVRAGLMLGTPQGRLLTRVALPSALPSIFNRLRVDLGIAWVLVIVSEMLAVKGGIGYLAVLPSTRAASSAAALANIVNLPGRLKSQPTVPIPEKVGLRRRRLCC
jgi:ABC-type nitrate/sulfonate/bicarbonate transport system permease component